ncbi:hypothetical protein ACEE45_02340 [Proteus vulgaris]|uniref:hypothetical protein n=1 Tax=Proteus TaxID=583 RepID=UPI001377974E|nr:MULTISPECIES: hypothetical protein [Proteus]MBG3092070.1 hypothetical protein [Proteus terrae subsp. cibarius]NBN87466.1 hypothetical protein [Proteus sp. G2300]
MIKLIDILPNCQCYKYNKDIYKIFPGNIVFEKNVLNPIFNVINPINGINLIYKFYGEKSFKERRRDIQSITLKFSQFYWYIKDNFKDENRVLYDITTDNDGCLLIKYVDKRKFIGVNTEILSKIKQDILIQNFLVKDHEVRELSKSYEQCKKEKNNLNGKIFILERKIKNNFSYD